MARASLDFQKFNGFEKRDANQSVAMTKRNLQKNAPIKTTKIFVRNIFWAHVHIVNPHGRPCITILQPNKKHPNVWEIREFIFNKTVLGFVRALGNVAKSRTYGVFSQAMKAHHHHIRLFQVDTRNQTDKTDKTQYCCMSQLLLQIEITAWHSLSAFQLLKPSENGTVAPTQ